jgi:predicted amidohydrolase
MRRKLKVAAIQMASGPNPSKNSRSAARLTERAVQRGAEFIVLPETFLFRGSVRRIAPLAEHVPGESLRPFMQIAKRNKVWILAGSVSEKKSGSSKSYNTSVLISPSGKVSALYRKMNLFNTSISGVATAESGYTLKGKKPVVAKVAGIKIGLSVCFDLRFPNLYHHYKTMGAAILCIPSSFTRKTGKDHWEILARARAIENQCFVQLKSV